MRKGVKTGEQVALGVLVDLFDWLDSLEPQPTTEVVPHQRPRNFGTLITDPLTPMGQEGPRRQRAFRGLFTLLAPPSRISSSLGIACDAGVTPDLRLE
jgi:hypothetical protein